jgi:protease I
MDHHPDLTGTTVAFLAANGVDAAELSGPRRALEATGAIVHLVSTGTKIQGFDHLEATVSFDVDRQVAEVNPDTYDALVLPGGVANPDELRTDPHAVAFAGSFLAADKLVAAICHAAWTLIEAEVVAGRQVTSWPSLRTDLVNAGASWVDAEVVVDRRGGPGTLVTCRTPEHVDAFNDALISALAETG